MFFSLGIFNVILIRRMLLLRIRDLGGKKDGVTYHIPKAWWYLLVNYIHPVIQRDRGAFLVFPLGSLTRCCGVAGMLELLCPPALSSSKMLAQATPMIEAVFQENTAAQLLRACFWTHRTSFMPLSLGQSQSGARPEAEDRKYTWAVK